jgi:hypothetical protein
MIRCQHRCQQHVRCAWHAHDVNRPVQHIGQSGEESEQPRILTLVLSVSRACPCVLVLFPAVPCWLSASDLHKLVSLTTQHLVFIV